MGWKHRRKYRGKELKRRHHDKDSSDDEEREERSKYCNYTEYRLARLLTNHNIPFEYSMEFDTINELGRPNHREVDFWLAEPIRIFWCEDPVQAIEVKGGRLDQRCWNQKKELRDVGINTFIATPAYITFWERHGFLRENGLYKRAERIRR